MPITTYSSLPRQRGKYDGRHSDDEYSLAKQVTKSFENIYSNGVSVGESMYEFLANVNRAGWVVTWFLLGYTVRKNGGLLSTPMF